MLPNFEPRVKRSFGAGPAWSSRYFLVVVLLFVISLTSFWILSSVIEVNEEENFNKLLHFTTVKERPTQPKQVLDEHPVVPSEPSALPHVPDHVTQPEVSQPMPPVSIPVPDQPKVSADYFRFLFALPPKSGEEKPSELPPPNDKYPLSDRTPPVPLDDPSVYTVKLPNIVAVDKPTDDPIVREQRNRIRNGFIHAYGWYEQKCMGRGEQKPVSGACHTNPLVNDIGLTVLDSLDTMLIMGLNDFYIKARDYLKTNLKWSSSNYVSLFETNIRSLGGLLSAYAITKDDYLLQAAEELAIKLKPAFRTGSGIPRTSVNLNTGGLGGSGMSVLAEVGTLQLEWAYLANLTKKDEYANLVFKVWEQLYKRMPKDALYPVNVNVEDGRLIGGHVTAGALGDSFYEYVLKYWLMTNEKSEDVRNWYYKMANSMLENLGQEVPPDMYYIAERHGGLIRKFDHLACFLSGMFGMSSLRSSDPAEARKHFDAADGIAAFCHKMYTMTRTGLPYESVAVSTTGELFAQSGSSYFLQRPEAVESWFYMWRLTHDQKYRNWAWEFFQNLEAHAKVAYGYTGLQDSGNINSKDDNQQSFFLAETLKYLFLIFCDDDVVPLDQFVFTTEAHVFPHFDPLVLPQLRTK